MDWTAWPCYSSITTPSLLHDMLDETQMSGFVECWMHAGPFHSGTSLPRLQTKNQTTREPNLSHSPALPPSGISTRETRKRGSAWLEDT